MAFCPACRAENSEFNAFCVECGARLASSDPGTRRSRGRLTAVLPRGTNVGHYEIASFLGAGSAGEVYSAFSRALGRTVALKLLSAELAADGCAKERIRREARAVSALRHPGVATVYEVGDHLGRPFIAMALCDGENLETLFARERLRIADVVRIVADVASALAAAHSSGITHRDVKPANIMVTRDGTVKLVDFGLAKMAHGEPSPLTRTGAVLGTVSYMAPEQIGGEPSDHRVDLWAIGVVLYEAIAGVLPFAGPRAAFFWTTPFRFRPSARTHRSKSIASCPSCSKRTRPLAFSPRAKSKAACARFSRAEPGFR